MKTQISTNGIVTLTDDAAKSREDSPLWNHDLRPVEQKEHSWRAHNFATLWMGMCICIPTFSLANGILFTGMSLAQALFTMLLGNLIVLIPILLNSHAGAKYGIPYAVFARLWYGSKGAQIPTIIRGLVAAAWFGVNCWFGATAIDACISAFAPSWAAFGPHTYIILAIFWLLNIYVGVKGPQFMKRVSVFVAPTLAIAAIVFFIWAIMTAQKSGGFIEAINTPSRLATTGEFLKVFFPSLMGVIGFWATLALNIPDFCRYSKSQKAHVVGQTVALPTTMTIFSFIAMSIALVTIKAQNLDITSTAVQADLSSPIGLVTQFPPVIVLIGAIVITVSSLTLNVNANLVAATRAAENMAPKKINYAMGAMLAGIVGITLELIFGLSGNVVRWSFVSSLFLGPVDGIAVADYWISRKRRMNLIELYNPGSDSPYNYSKGFNISAVIATVVPVAICVASKLIGGSLLIIWDNCWLVGIVCAIVIYPLLMRNSQTLVSQAMFDEITEYKEKDIA